MKKFEIESLDSDYLDPMQVMYHACFQCLINFVEKESGLRHCTYKDDDQKKHIDIACELYVWWIKNREDLDTDTDESQEKLEQLVKIRNFLWT
jgi:hypothetical protein